MMSTEPKSADEKLNPAAGVKKAETSLDGTLRDTHSDRLTDPSEGLSEMASNVASEVPSNVPSNVASEVEAGVAFVVGVGASAGGLQSVEKLLSKIRSGTGSALIVVQHFSPDVVSSMAEILGRSTDLQIQMVTHGMKLQPDTIFLIPPGKEIRLNGNKFESTDVDRKQVTRVIDILFQSLATSRGSTSIGVILSGTGSDGSKGIRAIRAAGGTTLVESFETAQFDGMPKSATQTGSVDFILSPDDLSDWLNRQFHDPSKRPVVENAIAPEALSGIQLIFSLLTKRHEVDFSAYKPSTVARRIERRQQICKQKSIHDYAEFANESVEELDLLYHDLLIGVTKFFRDTDAFLALERCLTDMVKEIPDGETLRIWSAGCATGEESYSLAMLAHDAFERLGRAPNYKVFATDIHQRCLDFASQGFYANDTMEYVSNERQAKFFAQESPTHFRVSNVLRKNMVFARHNVFNDPPFTNVQLVTCRNLLIYLKTDAQLRAISSFHFALQVDGLMMLGCSETVGPLAEEFRHIDKTWRIFQKIKNRPNLLSHYLSSEARTPNSGPRQLVNILNRDRPESMSFTRLIECYDLILREFITSGLLLDENRNILHVFGDANKYLSSKSGRFSGNLASFLDDNSKVAITATLVRAQQQPGREVILDGLELVSGNAHETIDVSVRAFEGTSSVSKITWLVEFIETDLEREDREKSQPLRVQSSAGNYAELETELVYTKDSLNITIAELATSNQELSAANEELVAANEELQSTNEELESVNEELYTVNLENNRRIDELKEVTDDLEVLLSTTEVGTLFLDANLCIRKFTSSIVTYFNLVPHDVGRPIDDFTNKSQVKDLDRHLREVLESGQEFLKNCEGRDGRITKVRIIPHLLDGAIAGLILTLSVEASV